MKCAPSWMGILQSQQPHFDGFVCPSEGTHSSRYLTKACLMRLAACNKYSSICTSTAYEGYETLYMCLKMTLEPSWIGLQPQQAQYATVSPLRVTQNSRYLPKAWPTSLAVTQWVLIHMHIHNMWRWWKHLLYVLSGRIPRYSKGCPGF